MTTCSSSVRLCQSETLLAHSLCNDTGEEMLLVGSGGRKCLDDDDERSSTHECMGCQVVTVFYTTAHGWRGPL